MEQDNSKLYISKMTKAARKNKIFVDYLRNDREATAVAAYSSRARLGMAAALPLEWAELKGTKGPKFLIAEFADWKIRLKKDPWAALLASKQAIPASLFRLIQLTTNPRGQRRACGKLFLCVRC